MNKFMKSLWERFNRLTYPQKFNAITLIFILPVFAFAPLLMDQMTRIDHYGHRELDGVLYLRPVWKLTEDMQSYSAGVHAYYNGKIQSAALEKSQSLVDADITELENIQDQFNTEFSLGNRLDTIKSQWLDLKQAVQNNSSKDIETGQAIIFKSLADLVAHVGDTSYLILDPDLNTYYMMDAVLLKLPDNQNLLFETRQIAEQIANQGELTEENKTQLTSLIARIKANLEAMNRNIEVALQNDPTGSIQQLVSGPLNQYQLALRSFTNAMSIEINKSSAFAFHTTDFDNVYRANSALYAASSRALELGVSNRIDTLTARLYWMIAIALLSILIAFMIGHSTMQTISGPLVQLFNATKRLASGDMTARIPVSQSSDELGQVGNAFNQMAMELEKDKLALLARTEELNTAHLQSEKRARDLQTIGEIIRISSSETEFHMLLPLITVVVSEKFNVHHAAIFLVDEKREFAVLQAANSHGGRQMLANGYKLQLSQSNIVGYVAATGRPRLAFNMGMETVFFNNPYLPDILSELALPLRSGREIIGVLDVQSRLSNAFSQEDMNTLTTLADQITIAIQSARALEQTRRALKRAEFASAQLVEKAWTGFMENLPIRGFRYDGIKPEALRNNENIATEKEGLIVPVQLRGQTIGRLRLKAADLNREWTADERAIIEATAERVAIALENARLLDVAQKRAARETFLSEIGTKLGSSFQVDSILRDTVEELGQALNGTTISLQLINPSVPSFGTTSHSDDRTARRNGAE